MARPQVRIVQRRVLPGSIDGHRPILVTFRIKGPQGWFRLTVICVNWGRGYETGEFHRNVMSVLRAAEDREYVVIFFQEIDEADEDPEHREIRAEMEPGTSLIQWQTREPIAVSPGVTVLGSRKTMTMDQGSAIGAPKGTGPRRYLVSARILIEDVVIGLGNQHPHRNMDDPAVQKARRRGERITRMVLAVLARVCDLVIDGGDFNDLHYPMSHPDQRTAFKRGLDYIRYIVTKGVKA